MLWIVYLYVNYATNRPGRPYEVVKKFGFAASLADREARCHCMKRISL
jgi:hypothetical protein